MIPRRYFAEWTDFVNSLTMDEYMLKLGFTMSEIIRISRQG